LWKSSKQTVTKSSTIYAEFVACYEATGQAVWFKKFIPRLRAVNIIKKSLKINCDKEKIQNHTISLEHISTKQMLIDLFTKGLPSNVFNEHVVSMGLRESI
jgi:hypothetical protein